MANTAKQGRTWSQIIHFERPPLLRERSPCRAILPLPLSAKDALALRVVTTEMEQKLRFTLLRVLGL
jgi:hypothetical protein